MKNKKEIALGTYNHKGRVVVIQIENQTNLRKILFVYGQKEIEFFLPYRSTMDAENEPDFLLQYNTYTGELVLRAYLRHFYKRNHDTIPPLVQKVFRLWQFTPQLCPLHY